MTARASTTAAASISPHLPRATSRGPLCCALLCFALLSLALLCLRSSFTLCDVPDAPGPATLTDIPKAVQNDRNDEHHKRQNQPRPSQQPVFRLLCLLNRSLRTVCPFHLQNRAAAERKPSHHSQSQASVSKNGGDELMPYHKSKATLSPFIREVSDRPSSCASSRENLGPYQPIKIIGAQVRHGLLRLRGLFG